MPRRKRELIFSDSVMGRRNVVPDFATLQTKFDEFIRIIQINPVERTLRGEPVTLKDIAEHLDLHYLTISKWNKSLHKKGQKPLLPPINGSFVESMKLVEAIERIDETIKKGGLKSKRAKDNDEPFQFEIGDEQLLNEQPKEWLKQQLPQIFKALVASCVKGNPVATKLVCELVDPEYKTKQESSHINADIIARLVFEAQRKSDQGADKSDSGVGAVSGGLPLLSQELRLPSGQDTAEDSQI